MTSIKLTIIVVNYERICTRQEHSIRALKSLLPIDYLLTFEAG